MNNAVWLPQIATVEDGAVTITRCVIAHCRGTCVKNTEDHAGLSGKQNVLNPPGLCGVATCAVDRRALVEVISHGNHL